jgi:hypothetical protein
MLILLRNILRDDFSEYNAKPYQTQTRLALLNLCSYAYDHEVRLAARMVLDYISAHYAVSSNDLRRMVPFRRRNEEDHGRVKQLPGGFMNVGLLEWDWGADPMTENFAIQSGNLRAYETGHPGRPFNWSIASDGGDSILEVLSNYRLPPSIHDLFVNDLHRRFFQRLHRAPQDNVEVTGRNCDNYEIYAGSPSYLITAGGSPAPYAIDPGPAAVVSPGKVAQQLGVALTTSFMPTGSSAGPGTLNIASELIQFSSFSDRPGEVANYGVAPDFACGYQVHLPGWVVDSTWRQAVSRLRELGTLPTTETVSVRDLIERFKSFPQGSVKSVLYQMREIMAKNLQFDRQFLFVDRGSSRPGKTEPAGFYLAIYRDGDFAFLEAFDTWLNPNVSFEEFKTRVLEQNGAISLQNNVESQYTTQNGNKLHFVIWKNEVLVGARYGAKVLRIEYEGEDSRDSAGDAGNITDKFLNGTVMNSLEEGSLEINNHSLGTKITLDMRDLWHPRRTSENGEVEQAGFNNEVWVNFGWTGTMEGDFFRPFNTIKAAAATVADGGVINIMPGWTNERPVMPNNKRIRLVAPIGNVKIGVR